MKIGIPVFQDRLSPVFDSSGLIRVFTHQPDGRMTEGASLAIHSLLCYARIEAILAQHIDLLICAAISRECQILLEANGVVVLAGLFGPATDIVAAYLAGRLDDKQFHLPCWKGPKPSRPSHPKRGSRRKNPV